MTSVQNPSINRVWHVRKRPEGSMQESDFALVDGAVEPLADGTARVRVALLSIDPLIRKWLDDGPAAIPLDSVVRGLGVGEVVESRSADYAVGDLVVGMTGWQEQLVVGAGAATLQVVPSGLDASQALDLYGFNWVTAYFGMTEVGKPGEGDVVVVSAAAGATGSIAGQIARISGAAAVVGIAGGQRKCAWLVDQLGFDAAVDHRAPDFAAQLAAACPDGISLYWDNVGGAVLDTVITQLAAHARVVLCGAVSTFDTSEQATGLRNYPDLITKRVRMQGFGVTDYLPQFADARRELSGWVADGSLRATQHVIEGLAGAPSALQGVLVGENLGKTVVRL